MAEIKAGETEVMEKVAEEVAARAAEPAEPPAPPPTPPPTPDEPPEAPPETTDVVRTVVAQINKPVDGTLKTPTTIDAQKAREAEATAGKAPHTITWWNAQLLKDYNLRVETPTYAPGYVPGQVGIIKKPPEPPVVEPP
ncbi:hypothetical protein KKE06_05855, partial [Candidatus Micrarchaeota archaeon]|nr:hypothetical protein [Candidatus Micrarchaeota archaeon]